MSSEQSLLRLVDLSREESGPAVVGVDLLHQPPVRRADIVLTRSRLKPKDLIGLLLAHGARARRATRPRCGIFLDVLTPSGMPAVEISLK